MPAVLVGEMSPGLCLFDCAAMAFDIFFDQLALGLDFFAPHLIWQDPVPVMEDELVAEAFPEDCKKHGLRFDKLKAWPALELRVEPLDVGLLHYLKVGFDEGPDLL